MTAYKLVRAETSSELESEVQQHLEMGWSLSGSAFVVHESSASKDEFGREYTDISAAWFFQPMTKEK